MSTPSTPPQVPPAPPQPTVEAVNGTSTPPYRRILQSGYSKYPTVSTSSTPPQVRRHSRRRRSRRWMARAHHRTPQVRGLKVPVGSTQSTPWECGLNPMGVLRARLVSTSSMPCEYSKYHTGRLGSYTQHGTPYEYSKSTLAGSFSAIPTWAFPARNIPDFPRLSPTYTFPLPPFPLRQSRACVQPWRRRARPSPSRRAQPNCEYSEYPCEYSEGPLWVLPSARC